MHFFRGLALLALAGFAGLVLAGFAGALHGAGDSFAVFRPQAAAALLAVSVLLWLLGMRGPAFLGAALALGAGLTVAPHLSRVNATGQTIAIYQKNLRYDLADPAPLSADIRATGAEIVTLQEVNGRTRAVADGLADAYPTRITCRFGAVGGPAILSVWPGLPGSTACFGEIGLVTTVLETPAGPLRVVSLHLHWPWPYGQPGQLREILPILESFPEPTILAGDFNMVRWSHALRTLGRASRTAPAGASHTTLPGRVVWPGLPIDHVLTPGGAGTTQIRPAFGSDHLGLLAQIPVAALSGD